MLTIKFQNIVWPDPSVGERLEKGIEAGQVPNLLLYGPPGTGKTTICRAIADRLGVDSVNLYELNGGMNNTVGDLGDLDAKLNNNFSFITEGSNLRLVIYDEIDVLSTEAIKRLKAYMDQHQASVRWLFTTNNPEKLEKIDPAFVNRCYKVPIDFARDGLAQSQYLDLLENAGFGSMNVKTAKELGWSIRSLVNMGGLVPNTPNTPEKRRKKGAFLVDK